jgi:hypothetical protein
MSEYAQALAELTSLPGLLDERLARIEREVEAERRRREAEIEGATRDQEAVASRLETVLGRAREEGVRFDRGEGSKRGDGDPLGADPIEYARQLVTRLEEALAHFTHTRDALAAEEAKLSESERRQAVEERHRREREELRRNEQWERARQGTVGILAGLVAATLIGFGAGFSGSPLVLAVPILAGLACLIQATVVTSTLPALAVQRASGSMPAFPGAPPREARMAAVGNAAAALALCAAAVSASAFATAAGVVAPASLLLAVCGALGVAFVWTALPQRK